jgi:hypothetical protein
VRPFDKRALSLSAISASEVERRTTARAATSFRTIALATIRWPARPQFRIGAAGLEIGEAEGRDCQQFEALLRSHGGRACQRF